MTIGTQSQTVFFTLTLTDPCPGASLLLTTPNAFTGPFQYILGDLTPTVVTYDPFSLFSTNTAVSCGNLVIAFYNQADDTTPDGAVFSQTITSQTQFNFVIGAGPLTDISKAGDYNIYYKIWYQDYAANFVQSGPFLVSVIDSCNPHTGLGAPVITASTTVPQSYVITDPATLYQVPAFTVTPAICQSRLEYAFDPATDSSPSIIGVGGSAATFAPLTRVFTFITSDTALADDVPNQNGVVYQLTVTATISGTSYSTQGQVQLTIYNPCYLPNYLSVTAVTPPDFYYTIYATAPANYWQHYSFITTVSVNAQALCGPLVYTVNGGALDAYITYTESQFKIEINSQDRTLISGSPYTYTVSTELANYPGYGVASAQGQIYLQDPCDAPFSIALAPYDDFDSDYSYPAVWNFPTTTVAPSECLSLATYTC